MFTKLQFQTKICYCPAFLTCTHSLKDRIKVCGTFDPGSIPGGCTEIMKILFFLSSIIFALGIGSYNNNSLFRRLALVGKKDTYSLAESDGPQNSKAITKHVLPNSILLKVESDDRTVNKNITWPQLQNISDKNVQIKVEKILNFQTITGYTLNELKEDPSGITGTNYEVNYDDNNVLSISISTDYMGAYPSTNINNFNINLTNGELLQPLDIFKQDNLSNMLGMLNKNLSSNIAKDVASVKVNNPTSQEGECSEEIISSGLSHDQSKGKFEAEKLDFKVNPQGIEFIHDFGFPHVILACEPDGSVFLSWSQLKSFIRSDSPLGRKVY
jgi:hypothetical protein